MSVYQQVKVAKTTPKKARRNVKPSQGWSNINRALLLGNTERKTEMFVVRREAFDVTSTVKFALVIQKAFRDLERLSAKEFGAKPASSSPRREVKPSDGLKKAELAVFTLRKEFSGACRMLEVAKAKRPEKGASKEAWKLYSKKIATSRRTVKSLEQRLGAQKEVLRGVLRASGIEVSPGKFIPSSNKGKSAKTSTTTSGEKKRSPSYQRRLEKRANARAAKDSGDSVAVTAPVVIAKPVLPAAPASVTLDAEMVSQFDFLLDVRELPVLFKMRLSPGVELRLIKAKAESSSCAVDIYREVGGNSRITVVKTASTGKSSCSGVVLTDPMAGFAMGVLSGLQPKQLLHALATV